MGMSFSPAWKTKQHLINLITRSESNQKCLEHTLRGNVLWSVWVICNTKGVTRTIIRCDLLLYDRTGKCWGYKDLCEADHPYYYSCPLKYLEMAPVACKEWRDKVQLEHRRKTLPIKPGMYIGLAGKYKLGIVQVYAEIKEPGKVTKYLVMDKDSNKWTITRGHFDGRVYASFSQSL